MAGIRRRHRDGTLSVQEAVEQMDEAGMTARQFRQFIGVRKGNLGDLVSHINDYPRCAIDVDEPGVLRVHGWLGADDISDLTPDDLALMLGEMADAGLDYPIFIAGDRTHAVAQTCDWAEYDTTYELDTWAGWRAHVEDALSRTRREIARTQP